MNEENLTVTDEEILPRLAQVISKNLRIPAETITMDSHLDTLGADSLDLVVISMDLEDEFEISLPDKNVFRLAEEVFGPNVLVQDGKLTEEGKRFLARRVPEIRPEDLEGDITPVELRHLLMGVRSWVRLIRGLMGHTPKVCAECGGTLGVPVVGVKKCAGCGKDAPIPLGEELNRRWIRDYYEREYLPFQPKGLPATE